MKFKKLEYESIQRGAITKYWLNGHSNKISITENTKTQKVTLTLIYANGDEYKEYYNNLSEAKEFGMKRIMIDLQSSFDRIEEEYIDFMKKWSDDKNDIK